MFRDAGNSKIERLDIDIPGTGSNRLYIRRGLSNGNNNSGIYVIRPNIYTGRYESYESSKTISELNQEGYIIFE